MSLAFLDNTSILVTGGTGSFGQVFVRYLLQHSSARRIVVFSRDELKQSIMQTTIPDPEGRLRFFLGDIRDKERLERAFHDVDFVVHAAALKQVPALEYNPLEAVKTNILGTQNIINAALDQDVKKVLFISTDKAANPANLYGATKLCAEKLIVNANAYAGHSGTRFSATRYGNVLGSRGSILTLVEQQKSRGKLQLTHEQMTRFWITLHQGTELVLMALEQMHGGEIFIPKAPSMYVKELLLAVAPGSEFEIIGIRPGEKLHEVLITPEESRHTKEFENHFVIVPEHEWWDGTRYGEGKQLPDHYSFTSLNNTRWLDAEGLKALLETISI